MALPALSLDEVLALDADGRRDYFMEHARRTDAPLLKYAVRVGSKTFYSNDTHDLRQKMECYVRNVKRNRKAKEKRDAKRYGSGSKRRVHAK